ncbi:MAG: acyl CoA:acetate/3-ketoacid CoA transferase, partial [Firmicutes bacterium]|nr:acyl CoA:acetate/3-ketoacid CoA transferase [Bacillota bacterium]
MAIQFLSADEAVKIIKDNATVAVEGFAGNVFPEEVALALEKRFLETGCPKNLRVIHAAGIGDGGERGMNHFGHEGLVEEVIAGHFNLAPKLAQLLVDNKIKGYNLPQGVISQLFREIAAHRPGVITHVGLKTFVDPRLEGGKVNKITTEDIVEVVHLKGQEYLFYHGFPIDVALIRGTYADEQGNISLQKEADTLEVTSMATAAHNSGGLVIAQVEKIVTAGSLDPRLVKVPGFLVDVVVVAKPEHHKQTWVEDFNPAYCGD